MARLLYLDCFSGASGDMLIGACLDAGLPLAALQEALGGLALEGVRLESQRAVRAGIQGTAFRVLDEAGTPVDAPHDGQAHHHGHHHAHRHLADILKLLERTRLSTGAKTRAEALFRRLAEAEAAVHGIPVERVHFHEVGALDSIIDVVGGVFALEWFGADEIVASPLNTGSGTVRCAHGLMPVPAPATARLVAGVPVYAEGPQVELLTPTGALLVTGHAARYGPLPPVQIDRVGYGAGSRDLPDRPNLLRLVVGTTPASASEAVLASPEGVSHERLLVLECELDDLNPQVFGVLMTRLLDAGARDVYYTPVQMKKGRPGTLVTVLATPSQREGLLDLLFSETTTLGVRIQEAVREVLARESVDVMTSLGPVRIKLGRRGGRLVNASPEFEDCARLAHAHGVPVKEVLAEAVQAWRSGGGRQGS